MALLTHIAIVNDNISITEKDNLRNNCFGINPMIIDAYNLKRPKKSTLMINFVKSAR